MQTPIAAADLGYERENEATVMVGGVADENVFQIRLNELFSDVGRRLTNAAVVRGLLERGCRISKPYLSQMRHGTRANPSDEVVAALADYFGVSPGYFFTVPWSGDRCRIQGEDAALIGHLDDLAMKELLMSANGLSPGSLELLADLAAKLRVSDQRRVVPADSPSYVRLVELALGNRDAAARNARPLG